MKRICPNQLTAFWWSLSIQLPVRCFNSALAAIFIIINVSAEAILMVDYCISHDE